MAGNDTDTLLIKTGKETDTLNIKEVIIKGHHSPDVYSGLSRIVHTINHETILNMPVNNIQDILEYVTALDIRQRGSHGVQADISMRGGSFEQVLILLNGVRINDPQTGHHNMNIPVSAADIERIEILEGPGSRIYGPNAFSGAVNIITREPGGNNFSGYLKGGEYGYVDLYASGGFHTGHLQNFISLRNSFSNGFVENTDFKISNIFYRGISNTDIGTIDIQAGYMDKSFGASNFYSALYPEQFEKIATTFTNLTYKSGSSVSYSQSVYWRRLRDRFELFRNDSPTWYQGHNYHMTDIYGTNATVNIPYYLGNIYFGSEIRTECIYSSVLGEKLDVPKAVINETNAFYNYYKKRTQINLTTGNSILINRFAFSSGMLVSKTNSSGWGLYGGIDMSFKIDNRISWFSSWNQSLRIPSFTEMYYSGPVQKGNSQLKPEEANTIETGFRLREEDWLGHIAIFRRKGDNIIDWVKKDNELIWESRNITFINTFGFEFELAWKRPEGLRIPIKEIRTGYAFLDISKKSENFISAYVLDHLRHKIVASVTIPIYRTAEMVLLSVYQDRAGTFTSASPDTEIPYDPFLLVDIGTNFQLIKGFALSIEISNLFNTSYADIGNVPVPGRWIKAGIYKNIKY